MSDDISSNEIVRRFDEIARRLDQILLDMRTDRDSLAQSYVRKDVHEVTIAGLQNRIESLSTTTTNEIDALKKAAAEQRDARRQLWIGVAVAFIGIMLQTAFTLMGVHVGGT